MKLLRVAAILGVAAGLAACSAVERRQPPAPVEEPAPRVLPAPRLPDAEAAPAPPAAGSTETPGSSAAPGVEPWPRPAPGSAPRSSGAVVALLEEARRSRETGDLNRSAATLERALRIEPRNPWLWNRLAHLRLEQGRLGEAGDLAAKSNTLAGNNPKLQRDNWQLIAAARRAAGDATGARAAEHKASSIR